MPISVSTDHKANATKGSLVCVSGCFQRVEPTEILMVRQQYLAKATQLFSCKALIVVELAQSLFVFMVVRLDQNSHLEETGRGFSVPSSELCDPQIKKCSGGLARILILWAVDSS